MQPPASETPLAVFRRRLFAPVDIAILVYFRIFFGLILLWEVKRYFAADWIGRYWIEPTFLFKYYGFEWVRPWPGIGMYLHFLGLGAAALCMVLGLFYRVAAVLFFVGFTYAFLLEQTRYLNHFYFVCCLSFILMFLPAHRAFSLDAWRRPQMRVDTAPAWTLWLLRAQVGIVYFYGGIAKIDTDWLAGWPLRMWLADSRDLFLIGPYLATPWAPYFFAWGGMLFDLLIVPALLWPKTRWIAFLVAVGFNFTNDNLFEIGIFPWMMIAGSALYFDPSWPRRIFNRWPDPTGIVSHVSAHPRRITALLTLYMAVQCLLPLRHLLYPGDADWTEEGHLFSWHMKLRDKEGVAAFFITDLARGETWEADLEDDLTERQAEKMAARPEMVLQFAHHLARKARDAGRGPVSVHAEVYASLNGRKPQRLIAPDVDLAAQPRSLAPATWIVPLTEPLTPVGGNLLRTPANASGVFRAATPR